MKNKNVMYGICLIACALGLIDTDYANLTALSIIAIVAMITAVISIVVNMYYGRKK